MIAGCIQDTAITIPLLGVTNGKLNVDIAPKRGNFLPAGG